MFVNYVKSERLKNNLLNIENLNLFNTHINEKDVEPEIVEHIISVANSYLNDAEFILPTAYDYMSYFNSGSRGAYTDKIIENRKVLVMLISAEWLTRKGKYIEKIINYCWSFTELATWVIPPHQYCSRHYEPKQKILPDIYQRWFVDIYAAEIAGLLAMSCFLFKNEFNAVNESILQRIKVTVRKRIVLPFLENDDFWWMGFVKTAHPMNNWNPWSISNILIALSVLEDDNVLRYKGFEKSCYCLQNYIDKAFDDGGCDEGPGYWGGAAASLLDCLQLLNIATNGDCNFFNEPLIKKMGDYLCKVHIAENKYASFADARSYTIHAPTLIYRYGKLTASTELMSLAYEQLKVINVDEFLNKRYITMCFRWFLDLIEWKHLSTTNSDTRIINLKQTNFLPNLQVMSCRQYNNYDGIFLCCKGGTNEESHNHNDVGNYVVYKNANPMIIDVGCEAYTIETFGPNRYSLWNMMSSNHNCPEINGLVQKFGLKYRASDVEHTNDDLSSTMTMNLHNAYEENDVINCINRKIVFYKGDSCKINVIDTIKLKLPTADIKNHIMCVYKPIIADENTLIIQADDKTSLKIQYDSLLFNCEIQPIAITDDQMIDNWKTNELYKIVFSTKVKTNDVVFNITLL